ncbi:MAG: MFS transporter, partial [Anaerolineaceae bacterium]|nr:MFS transporter [Anaerolineaceae bacterium]
MNLSPLLRRTGSGAAAYAGNLKAFSPNARLYLINAVITGASMGVFRFLLNFFVLSKGYNNEFVGNLVTASSLTALIVALPMGYLADLLGRKRALVIGGTITSLTVFVMVLWPTTFTLVSMNVLLGIAQSLVGVTMGPFLMENSTQKERTYLFSFASGLSTLSAFVGNWIGGYLPTWMGAFQNVSATSSTAYAWSLGLIGFGAATAVIPLIFMRIPKLEISERSAFAPLTYFFSHSGNLSRLVL